MPPAAKPIEPPPAEPEAPPVEEPSTAPDPAPSPEPTGTPSTAPQAPAEPAPTPEPAPPTVDLAPIRNDYTIRLRSLIDAKKRYPPPAKRLRRTGRAQVAFTVGADGSLSDLTLRTSSGTEALDDAALQAVRDAAPFPPLPPELGSTLEVMLGLTFQLE
ncbi:MAG TPA: energy transducer TonB [bacterium]|nr:energy transducer TonB [bacterium]